MSLVTTVRGRARSGPHVFIAIPSGDSTIFMSCVSSLFAGAHALDEAGYTVTLCTEGGNVHVDDARNSLVREFLKSDADIFVFIDADVGFRAGDLVSLVSSDRDIVAGVYPKKQAEEDFPVFPLPGELWTDREGLVEVEGAPTGFMKIGRHVLETLASKALSVIAQNGDPVPYRIIFERTFEAGRRWSGDYAFCRKARREGFRVYVNPEMEFSHTGIAAWSGTLGRHWKRKHGVEARELADKLDRALRRVIAGSPDAGDFYDLSLGWGNGWAASPELLAHLWRLSEGSVLECGSGLSTLVLAARGCRVTALEHDPMFASHVRAMLDRYGLSAEILCKPLRDGWYDFDGGSYDVLLIDGPPRGLGDRATALERVRADLIFWDDYVSGLTDPQILGEQRVFAIQRATELAKVA